MEVHYIGHAAVYIKGRKNMLFDPWINNNPVATPPKELDPTHVFVSHSHRDHGLADAIEISKSKNSTLIGVFELATYAAQQGASALGANIGGLFSTNELDVFLTPALHSSSLGSPVGFVVKAEKTIYHAGDTAYYSEMQRVGKRFNIDIAFLPIGGTYTMDIEEAVYAVEVLKPKVVVPIHYNTFPIIKKDPVKFKDAINQFSECIVLNPGDSINL